MTFSTGLPLLLELELELCLGCFSRHSLQKLCAQDSSRGFRAASSSLNSSLQIAHSHSDWLACAIAYEVVACCFLLLLLLLLRGPSVCCALSLDKVTIECTACSLQPRAAFLRLGRARQRRGVGAKLCCRLRMPFAMLGSIIILPFRPDLIC